MDLVDEKVSISELDFAKASEAELIKFEKEITDSILENEVVVSPNPTSGHINISSVFNIENVAVFDYSGKNIFTTTESDIDLSAYAKGVYFLKIKTGGSIILKRVVLI